MLSNCVACRTPAYLVCSPEFFGVDYVINPWMAGNRGRVDQKTAARQWAGLVRILRDEFGASLLVVGAVKGSPDMVFTANAGLIREDRCMLANFRHRERQAEREHYRRWFVDKRFTLGEIPADLAFEGAGDALFDQGDARILWAASGFRTDRESHEYLRDFFGVHVISVALTDPRYYHLDTCFCPLPDGMLIWRPEAFDEASRQIIVDTVDKAHRYAVSQEAAEAFICNGIVLGSTIVANNAPEPSITGLRSWLAERGLALRTTPLWEFLKAGGSAKCLTLRVA